MILNSDIEDKIKKHSLVLEENISKLRESLSQLKRQITDLSFPINTKAPNRQISQVPIKKGKAQSKAVTRYNTKVTSKTVSSANLNANVNSKSQPKLKQRPKSAQKVVISKQKPHIVKPLPVTPAKKPIAQVKDKVKTQKSKANATFNKQAKAKTVQKTKKRQPKPKELKKGFNKDYNELLSLRKENTLLKQKLQTESSKNDQLTQMIDNLNCQFIKYKSISNSTNEFLDTYHLVEDKY